ncbi:MAG: hypothetical protein ABH884_04690 [Candidatus Komeilibacteria bacterium]
MTKTKMKIKEDNQQGIILVISLVIMAILISIAIGFSIFILSDLRQAAEIDNSVIAYYSADSGIERTLYLFRHVDKDRIADLSEDDKSGDVDGEVGDDWSIEESDDFEPVFFRQRLLNGQSVKLYFLGRKAGTNSSKSIKIEWFKGLNSPRLQVIFTQLTPDIDSSGALVYYTDINKVEISDTAFEGNSVCFDFKDEDLDGVSLSSPSDYVVELRAIGSGGAFIDNLSVTAHDETAGIGDCNEIGSYNPEAITNITIKSVGTHNNASQIVYAQIPPLDPLSNILGFVLFSQEDITKGY